MMDWETNIQQARLSTVIETQEFNLVALLKPSIKIDGDQWCVLFGENLQDGIAGFGESPIEAVYDFNKSWHLKIQKRSKAKP